MADKYFSGFIYTYAPINCLPNHLTLCLKANQKYHMITPTYFNIKHMAAAVQSYILIA